MNADIQQILVCALTFAAIFLPVLLWCLRRDDAPVETVQGRMPSSVPSVFSFMAGASAALELPLGVPIAHMFPERSQALEKRILASGINLSPGVNLNAKRIFAMQAVSGLIGCGLGCLLFAAVPEYRGPMAALWMFLTFVGWVYPTMRLDSYVQWRQNEVTRALPFAIDLISSAMRAGLEFGAAMRYYEGLKLAGPLTDEFATVLRDIELGKSRTEALGDMAGRVQTDTFSSFAGVVAYGTEIGASISETIRVQGEEMRRARFHIAERKAARAPSLMIFPLAVFILPAVFVIIIVPVMMQMGAAR